MIFSGSFLYMGAVVRRNDGRKTVVKGNNDDRWSSNDMVLWLVRRKNMIE
jgi:hypothetical protein